MVNASSFVRPLDRIKELVNELIVKYQSRVKYQEEEQTMNQCLHRRLLLLPTIWILCQTIEILDQAKNHSSEVRIFFHLKTDFVELWILKELPHPSRKQSQ